MPYPFELPTTGSVDLSHFYTSSSHPSLLLTATSKRAVLKDALKRYKRLGGSDRVVQLAFLEDAVQAYLPYLMILGNEQDWSSHGISIQETRSFKGEWRSTLSSSIPGKEPPRSKITSLQQEVTFVLLTLAYVKALLARVQLKAVHDNSASAGEQRTAAIVAATKLLLDAHGVSKYAASTSGAANGPIDVQHSTLTGIAELLIAEANLIFVAKDDPYATAVADDRDESNTDWMYKAPSIPKVRASLYARICVAASEHAGNAHAAFASSSKINDSLTKYANDLRRTARAKAIRLLAVNAEAAGSTGEALAWLNAAKKELGIAVDGDAGKRKGLRGLKQSWQERREDRKLEKGGEWGLDAGRLEEARVVEMLDAKWEKENNTVNVQVVPSYEPLLRQLPSGRDPHTLQPWAPPALDVAELSALRAAVNPDELYQAEEDDSGAEELYNAMPNLTVGGYPDVEPQKKGPASSYY